MKDELKMVLALNGGNLIGQLIKAFLWGVGFCTALILFGVI